MNLNILSYILLLIFVVACENSQIGNYTVTKPLAIYSVSPKRFAGANTIVTIEGKGFTNKTNAVVGGSPCYMTEFINANKFLCKAGNKEEVLLGHSLTLSNVGLSALRFSNPIIKTTVKESGQTASLKLAMEFLLPPHINEVSPSKLPIQGGVVIHLKGSNLFAESEITINDKLCAINQYLSEGELSCVSPANPVGQYPVLIKNPDEQEGKFASGVTYYSLPTLSLVTPNKGPQSGGTQINLQGQYFEVGMQIEIGGTLCQSIIVSSATLASCITPAHAPGLVDIKTILTSGESILFPGSFQYIAAPILNVITPSSGPVSGGNTVVLSGDHFQSGIQVKIGNQNCLNLVLQNSQLLNCQIPVGLIGTANVVATNSDGQISNTLSYQYIPPSSLISLSPSVSGLLGGATLQVVGTNFVLGSAVKIDGNNCATTFVSATILSCIIPAHSAGTAFVIIQNPDGQQSATLNLNYVPAAVLNTLSPSQGPQTGGTVVTLTGNGFQSGFQLLWNGVSIPFIFQSSTSLRMTTPIGSGNANVVVRDLFMQDSNAVTFQYVPAPVLSQLNPTSGPESGGTTITLTGNGFQAGAVVLQNGIPIPTQYVSSTQLTAINVAGAGSVNLQVKNPDAQLSNSLSFLFIAPPTLSSITPTVVGLSGGLTLNAIGSGFTNASQINVDGVQCITTFISASQLSCVLPAHAAGVVSISVHNSDGQNSGSLNLSYLAAPLFSSLSPNQGPELGGTIVSINGNGFQSGYQVIWNGVSIPFIFQSSNVITVTAPAATGTVNVTVRDSFNQDSNQMTYTYIPAPVLSQLNPISGPESGGTTITLTGNGFQAGAVVLQNGFPIPTQYISSTQLTVINAAGVGNASFQVRNVDTQLSNSLNFQFIPPPILASINPVTSGLSGGMTLQVFGSQFINGAEIWLGNIVCATALVSSTQLSCVLPAHSAGNVLVSVHNPDGQVSSSLPLNYIAAPSFSGLSPNQGPELGGNTVMIQGSGFQNNNLVIWNGISISYTFLSATSLRVIAPSGVGAASVVIRDSFNQNSVPINYLYLAAPILTQMNPNSGPEAGGTLITFTGQNFQSGATVFQGNNPLVTQFISTTQLTTLNSSGVGLVSFNVKNPDTQQSNSLTFQFIPAPYISTLLPNHGPASGGTLLEVIGNSFQAGAEIVVGGIPCSTQYVSTFSLKCLMSSHSSGAVAITVKNPDNQISNPMNFQYDAGPNLIGLNPNQGPEVGNTTIQIVGSGFLTGAEVYWNGLLITSTLQSLNSIQVYSPAGVGVATIYVKNLDGQISNSVTYTYLSAPVIISLNPSGGPASGGTAVSVNGTNFSLGAVVLWNGIAVPTVYFSSSLLRVTSPAGITSATVQVKNVDTQVSNVKSFFYTNPPYINVVSTNNSSSSGGGLLRVLGNDFVSGAVIYIDGQQCPTTFMQANELRCTLPPHPVAQVPVYVINPDGQISNIRLFNYTTPPAPIFTAVTPNYGPTTGGQTVIIKGVNLAVGIQVSFDSFPCTQLTYNSSIQITCVTPAHNAGLSAITLTNPDGQSFTMQNIFVYYQGLTVTQIQPAQGYTTGNQIITISGSGFVAGNSTVTIGPNSCQVLSVNAAQTQMTCRTVATGEGFYNVTVNVLNFIPQQVTLVNAFHFINPPNLCENSSNPFPIGNFSSVDYQAVPMGNEVFFWATYPSGASGYQYDTNRGFKFDPITKSWSQVSTVNAPAPRAVPVTVWTGSKIILWGGKDWFGILNSGGIYDPMLNSWSSMSSNQAPIQTPDLQSGFWNGSKLVVWEGFNYHWSHRDNITDGGLYDLATDTWSQASLVGAPTTNHSNEDGVSIVWTGTKLILWGGFINSNYQSHNEGSIYDSITDTWAPVNLANAPLPRNYAVSGYDGNHFVVLGGRGVGVDTTVYHYDLSNETWSSVSGSALFSNTGSAAMLATLNTMDHPFLSVNGGDDIVFQAFSSNNWLVPATGGYYFRYKYSTNQWTVVTDCNAGVANIWSYNVVSGNKFIFGSHFNTVNIFSP